MKLSFREWLKTNEMAGTAAILKNCKPTATYSVWGACSDLVNSKKSQKEDSHDKKKMGKGRR